MDGTKNDLDLEKDVRRAIELLDELIKTHEIHSPKLLALQKVMKSDFFNSVREVYEHIYNTISCDISPEKKANATAKATVAAFIAADGHAHPRVIELTKMHSEGLGFNILGGKEQQSPVFISRVLPGGAAYRHGGLRRGDQILAVNGVNVEGESHEKVVELLKAAHGLIRLVVRYTPSLLEELEQHFEREKALRRREAQSPEKIIRDK